MPVKLSVPLALNPENLDPHYKREPLFRERIADPELDALRGALTHANETAKALLEARLAISADATRTPQARALDVRKLALQKGEATAERLDAAKAKVAKARELLAQEISAPLIPPHQAHLSQEVRNRLAPMTDDARAKVLDLAFRQGDSLTVGSYLGAPAFLSGAGEADQAALRLKWQQQQHPDALDRLGRVGKALEAVERSGQSFVGLVETIANDPAAAMSEHAKAAADAAMKKVETDG